jgi:hypothetical protein
MPRPLAQKILISSFTGTTPALLTYLTIHLSNPESDPIKLENLELKQQLRKLTEDNKTLTQRLQAAETRGSWWSLLTRK